MAPVSVSLFGCGVQMMSLFLQLGTKDVLFCTSLPCSSSMNPPHDGRIPISVLPTATDALEAPKSQSCCSCCSLFLLQPALGSGTAMVARQWRGTHGQTADATTSPTLPC